MSNEMAVVVESQRALSLVGSLRPPAQVLAEAQERAVALRDVIALKPKKVMMNGEQYLEFEDWQTVAYFYGITAQEDGEPEFVDFGGVRGFKASAIAVDAHGRTLSRATAFCLSDEEKWSSRTKYEWAYVKKSGGYSIEDPGKDELVWEARRDDPTRNAPKKEKIPTGEESVPLFQLASMAQTRANAKALRNILSWVVVLAGYRTTPAEELDGKTSVEENGGGAPPAANPPKQSAKPKPAQAATNGAAKPAAEPAGPGSRWTPKQGERWTGPCPDCGKLKTVIISKQGPGWHCWKGAKENGGGCGASFTEDSLAFVAEAARLRATQTTIPADPPLNPKPAADDPFGSSLDPDAPGAEK